MNTIWKQANKFTEGRKGVKYIVCHWIGEGTGQSAANWFASPNNKVSSAHYVIEDNTIWQCVREGATAWAVGNWEINQWSISIEHSATPDRPASEATYQTSAKLIKEICERYGLPINRDTIKGHNEFVKTACPNGLDIDKIIELAKGEPMKKWTEAIKFESDALYGHLAPEDWAGGTIIQMTQPEVTKFKGNDKCYILIDNLEAASRMMTGDWSKNITELDVVPRSDFDGVLDQLIAIADKLGVEDNKIAIIKAIDDLQKKKEEKPVEPEPTPPTPPIIIGWLKTLLTYIKKILHIK